MRSMLGRLRNVMMISVPTRMPPGWFGAPSSRNNTSAAIAKTLAQGMSEPPM